MELEHLSSEIPIRHDEALHFMAKCLPVGISESTPYFVLLYMRLLLYLLNCLYLSSQVFSVSPSWQDGDSSTSCH